MKILLVYPKFLKFQETNPKILEVMNNPFYANYKTAPPLAIPILTALTPDEHDLYFIDENIEKVPYNEHFDLVAITCFTPQAQFAYDIADTFRKNGVLTVIGGIHPSNYPEDCSRHVDALVIGEAEDIWNEILRDADKKRLKKIYRSETLFDLNNYIMPDRRLYKKKPGYDWKPLLIQTFRGCDYRCRYCSIPGMCDTLRMRPVDGIINEIEQNLDFDGLFIADDQLLLPDKKIEKYAFDFFSGIKNLNYKKGIFLNASMLLNRNRKLLKLVKDCGINTIYLVMGFDPVSVNAISFDKPREAEYNIRLLQDHGFGIVTSVGVGLDVDTVDVFKRHIEFLTRNNLRHVEFWILTPFPGSPAWKKYLETGKILTQDFKKYNGAHCVFKPRKMTAKQLDDGLLYLWEEFFTRFPLKTEEMTDYYYMTEEYKLKHGLKKAYFSAN